MTIKLRKCVCVFVCVLEKKQEKLAIFEGKSWSEAEVFGGKKVKHNEAGKSLDQKNILKWITKVEQANNLTKGADL